MAVQEISGSEILSNILMEMNLNGKFPISVLTDKEGLPIASASTDGTDPERQSAVVAFIQKTSIQVTKQLGFKDLDEISFSYANGQHLISRPFNVKDNVLTLAIIVTDRDQPYRRAIKTAIAEIQKVWDFYWK